MNIFKRFKKSPKPFYCYELPSQPHTINIIDVAEQLLFIQSKDFPNRSYRPHKYRISYNKLQKLCYYAQAWYLALTSTELFEDEFEAWSTGPSNYKLYIKYRKYGWNDICGQLSKAEYDAWDDTYYEKTKWDKIPVDNSILFTQSQINFLQDLWKKYGCYEDAVLRNLSWNEFPWNDARVGLSEYDNGSGRIINKKSMEKYYKGLLPERGI